MEIRIADTELLEKMQQQKLRIMKRMKLLLQIIFLLIVINLNAQDITVLSYNIRLDVASDSLNRWDNRKDFLIGQLNFYEPTVFGVQEGLLHQLEEIKNGMPDYSYIGKGREDGRLKYLQKDGMQP